MNVDLKSSGVYIIASPDGGFYVGIAKHISNRWAWDNYFLEIGSHCCAALQDAYERHGGKLYYVALRNCPVQDLRLQQQATMDFADANKLYNRWSDPRTVYRTGVKALDNTSGYAGVHQFRNKWVAKRTINGKQICIGYYATPELANEARQEFDRRYAAWREANPGKRIGNARALLLELEKNTLAAR